MPPRKPDPYMKKQGKVGKYLYPVNDPTPRAVAGGGRVDGQDYTKYIKWTPIKIAVFSICVVTPYLVAVGILWFRYGLGPAAGLLALGICLAGFIGIMYWLAKFSF